MLLWATTSSLWFGSRTSDFSSSLRHLCVVLRTCLVVLFVEACSAGGLAAPSERRLLEAQPAVAVNPGERGVQTRTFGTGYGWTRSPTYHRDSLDAKVACCQRVEVGICKGRNNKMYNPFDGSSCRVRSDGVSQPNIARCISWYGNGMAGDSSRFCTKKCGILQFVQKAPTPSPATARPTGFPTRGTAYPTRFPTRGTAYPTPFPTLGGRGATPALAVCEQDVCP